MSRRFFVILLSLFSKDAAEEYNRRAEVKELAHKHKHYVYRQKQQSKADRSVATINSASL